MPPKKPTAQSKANQLKERTKALRMLQAKIRQAIVERSDVITAEEYRRLGVKDVAIEMCLAVQESRSYRDSRDLAGVYAATSPLFRVEPKQEAAESDNWDDGN